MPELMAKTDAAGRYEIHGVRKANTYKVSVKRDPEAGFMGRTVPVRDTPAYEPVTADISTAKGIILTGRLLDDQTGEPVPGRVCVGVLFDNEAAKSRPEFDSPDCYEDFAYTKADGVYRTVAPPGPVLLMAGANAGDWGSTRFVYEQMKPDPAYPDYFDRRRDSFRSTDRGGIALLQDHWCKVLKLKSDEPEVKWDVRLKRASRFEVKVRDAVGRPLAGTIVAGNTARDWATPEKFETDTCAVYELERAKPRLVVFLEPKRKLVGTLMLKGDEKEPAAVTLGPPGRIRGKVVDPAGHPIAGAAVGVNYRHRAAGEIEGRIHGDLRFAERPVETNPAGEFEMNVVIPGEPVVVYARTKNRFLEPPDRKKQPECTARAGEETDLGTITLKEE